MKMSQESITGKKDVTDQIQRLNKKKKSFSRY